MVEQMQAQATSTPTSPVPAMLERVLLALVILALALAPTQLTIEVKGIPVAPSEPLIGLAIVVWAVRWWWARDSRSLPPLTHWLVVLSFALGMFTLGDTLEKSVLKGAAQMFAYLIVAVTAFRSVLTTPRRVRMAVIAVLATTSLAVLLGVVQRGMLQTHFQPDPAKRIVFADSEARTEEDENAEADEASSEPKTMGYWDAQGQFHPRNAAFAYLSAETEAQVSSTFGSWSKHGYHASRTAYAAFLALVLPFALALLIAERRRAVAVWVGLLFFGVAVSVLAGYVMPAILIGLLVTGVALGPRVGRGVLIGVLGYCVLAGIVGGFNRREILVEPFSLKLSARETQYRYEDGTRHLKRFWGEQQAGLNNLRFSPLLGLGAGLYAVDYGQMGAIDNQRQEPDVYNGYLVAAVETGIIGLAALLLLFGSYLGLARRHARAYARNPWAAAQLGALVALIILTFVTYPWVRGHMVMIAFLLALIGNTATLAPGARINPQEEMTCE